MMSKLRSKIDLKAKSISHFFIQTLLLSVLAFTAPQVFAVTMDKNFDHYNTNFPLDGAHKTKARCDSCHKRGIFKGTPRDCESCHGSGSKVATTTMSNKHVRVSGECDTCHTQNAWTAVRMDHSAVSGTCKSCHGIVQGVTGPPPVHSKLDCGDCHRTRAWKPATGYVHSPEDVNCVQCHTPGGQASGTAKSPSHIPVTGQDCGACHRNDRGRFKPVSKMDHSLVSTNCKSCHDGSQTKIGAQSYTMSRRITHQIHVTDLNDCTACHKTGFTTWNGGTNVPVPRTGNSHNGKFTSQSCSTSGCHANGAGAAPQSHTLGMASPAVIAASCADCHAGTTSMKHAGNTKIGACKVCHTNSGAGRSMKGKKVSDATIHGTSVNSPETSSCDSCHRERDRGGSFKPASMRAHDGIKANACQNCHKGQVSNASQFSNQHATLTTSNQCETCHTNTSRFTRLNKSGVHQVATKTCSTCHATIVSYPTRSGWSSGSIKSTRHFSTTLPSCETCHTTSGTFVSNKKYSHTGIYPSRHSSRNCKSCHTTNAQNNVGRESNPGLTPQCGGCHGTRYARENPNSHLNAPLASMADCTAACHKPAGEHSTGGF